MTSKHRTLTIPSNNGAGLHRRISNGSDVDRLIELSRIYDSVIEGCISVEAANTASNCIPEWRTSGPAIRTGMVATGRWRRSS